MEFFDNAHDLTIVATRRGIGLARLSDRRIRGHLQAFRIALSGLLLVCLDSEDFSRQGRELHFQV